MKCSWRTNVVTAIGAVRFFLQEFLLPSFRVLSKPSILDVNSVKKSLNNARSRQASLSSILTSTSVCFHALSLWAAPIMHVPSSGRDRSFFVAPIAYASRVTNPAYKHR
jgi:hypothetical protein